MKRAKNIKRVSKKINTCGCECGGYCLGKYINGHANKNKRQSVEWKRKRFENLNTVKSWFKKGDKSWNSNLTKDIDDRVKRNAEKCRKLKRVKEIEIIDGKIVEHKYTKEVRDRLGENRKGENNNFYNKHHTEKSKQKYSETVKSRPEEWHAAKSERFSKTISKKSKEWHYKKWEKFRETRKKNAKPAWNKNKELSETHVRHIFEANAMVPNKTEILIDNDIQKSFLDIFKFVVGDNKTFVGGRSPDWICKSKKLIIEMFGNYFHGQKLTGRTKEQEEKQRTDHFAKYGYKTLIIWESELKDMEAVRFKIQSFLESEGILFNIDEVKSEIEKELNNEKET